jgi:hypothetical protein
MDSPQKQASDAVIELLQSYDKEPFKERPVTFWFYSDEELNLYRLAHRLQRDGYEIQYCGHAAASDDWLLIAEKTISPRPEIIEGLCHHFEELAKQMEVTFDGWETILEM